jgi:hypothetical protein
MRLRTPRAAFDVDVGIRDARLHSEVVQPHRRLIGRRDPVRPLVQHLEPHSLQHGLTVGQVTGPAEVKELEAQHARLRLERTVEAHPEGIRSREPRHHLEVGHGRAGEEVLAIGRGQRPGETPLELVAARLAERVDQRVLEIVVPAPRRQRKPCLQEANVEFRDLARHGAHRDHHPRQHGFGKVDVELRARAVESGVQDRLPLLAQLGRVGLARRVDEADDEALERIAPDEEPESLPLAQVQDAGRRAQEVVLARLEQLVARIGGEDVAERLAGMAAARHARAGDDVGRLAAQSGMSAGLALYAVDVYRPRKRCSPHTFPRNRNA